jgi:hypothetical protein
MTDDWRTDAAAWWASPEWHAYEQVYGDVPGARTKLLAAADWQTRILDVSPEPTALLRGMRKGRRGDIKKAEQAYEIVVSDRATGTVYACFLDYMWTHRRAHPGRRSDATYWPWLRWAQDGHGLIAVAYHRHPVAAAFFIVQGGWSYYGSAANLVDDVQPAVVWQAMLGLRAAGIRWAELGWQGQATDAEGIKVERFKRFFGGIDMPARLP